MEEFSENIPVLQVVDFGEFREMMLSAEPNALTRRQQSLKSRKSQSERSSLSSADSGNHMARKQQLGFSHSSLEARQAAMPQVCFLQWN